MGQIDLWGNEQEEEKVLTYEEKIAQAMDVFLFSAGVSEKYYHAPLLVAYSGGKDSDVLLSIAEKCLKPEQFEVMNSHTTVDAPQTVRHIEKVFDGLNNRGIKTWYHNRYPVKKTMWDLIVERRMPPTRIVRYCCAVLKEATTPNRLIAVGVRSDESSIRKKRGVFR